MPHQHAPDQSTASVARNTRRVVLITGGSRGIGAATALTFAQHGYDVALTYRNKAARAQEVVESIMQQGQRGLALACDMTKPDDVQRGIQEIGQWSEHLDALVLNASGGMERDLVATDPDYPMHINRDAQLCFVEAATVPARTGQYHHSGHQPLGASLWANGAIARLRTCGCEQIRR